MHSAEQNSFVRFVAFDPVYQTSQTVSEEGLPTRRTLFWVHQNISISYTVYVQANYLDMGLKYNENSWF